MATAIVGIALGVALAAIANGRGQIWRGQLSREAAEIAKQVAWITVHRGESMGEIEAPGHPGWKVKSGAEPADFLLTKEDGTPIEIDPSPFQRFRLEIVSPDGHHFSIAWLKRQ